MRKSTPSCRSLDRPSALEPWSSAWQLLMTCRRAGSSGSGSAAGPPARAPQPGPRRRPASRQAARQRSTPGGPRPQASPNGPSGPQRPPAAPRQAPTAPAAPSGPHLDVAAQVGQVALGVQVQVRAGAQPHVLAPPARVVVQDDAADLAACEEAGRGADVGRSGGGQPRPASGRRGVGASGRRGGPCGPPAEAGAGPAGAIRRAQGRCGGGAAAHPCPRPRRRL